MPLREEPFTLLVHANIEKEPRMMRFDLNALADFEQQCGMGIGQLLQMKAVFATTRAMFWCGAHHSSPTLTLEAAGDLLQEYLQGGHGTINDVMTSCFEIATNQGALGTPSKPGKQSKDPKVLTAVAEKPKSRG